MEGGPEAEVVVVMTVGAKSGQTGGFGGLLDGMRPRPIAWVGRPTGRASSGGVGCKLGCQGFVDALHHDRPVAPPAASGGTGSMRARGEQGRLSWDSGMSQAFICDSFPERLISSAASGTGSFCLIEISFTVFVRSFMWPTEIWFLSTRRSAVHTEL